jgi:hypothetical protein
METRNRHKRGTGKTDPQRVIGYVRVSSDAQRAALKQWCAAHGGQLVLTCTDRGVSGGAALDQRPGLLAALAALKQHNAAILLVARRDRLRAMFSLPRWWNTSPSATGLPCKRRMGRQRGRARRPYSCGTLVLRRGPDRVHLRSVGVRRSYSP